MQLYDKLALGEYKRKTSSSNKNQEMKMCELKR